MYTLLKYTQNVAVKTGQPDIVVTFDQAIYAKAQEIIWSTNGEFSNIAVHMGAFHTSMTFVAVIGKRFGDAGLMSLMVESATTALARIFDITEFTKCARQFQAIDKYAIMAVWMQ